MRVRDLAEPVLAGPVCDDERFGAAGWSQHLNLAADNDEERNHSVSDLDEHLAARDRAAASMRSDSPDLLGCERRKEALFG